ncbi:hypothetical protein D3C80_2116350 [compost metagenome]
MQQVHRTDRGRTDKLSQGHAVRFICQPHFGNLNLQLFPVGVGNPADLYQRHRKKGLLVRSTGIPELGGDLTAGVT